MMSEIIGSIFLFGFFYGVSAFGIFTFLMFLVLWYLEEVSKGRLEFKKAGAFYEYLGRKADELHDGLFTAFFLFFFFANLALACTTIGGMMTGEPFTWGFNIANNLIFKMSGWIGSVIIWVSTLVFLHYILKLVFGIWDRLDSHVNDKNAHN